MSMLERRINMIRAKNPQLINSLDRNKNHPLIRKYSHIYILTNILVIISNHMYNYTSN